MKETTKEIIKGFKKHNIYITKDIILGCNPYLSKVYQSYIDDLHTWEEVLYPVKRFISNMDKREWDSFVKQFWEKNSKHFYLLREKFLLEKLKLYAEKVEEDIKKQSKYMRENPNEKIDLAITQTLSDLNSLFNSIKKVNIKTLSSIIEIEKNIIKTDEIEVKILEIFEQEMENKSKLDFKLK